MMVRETTSRKKRVFVWGIVALVVVLGVGVVLTWRALQRADQELRGTLLQKARLVAGAMNVDRVRALLGSEADVEKAEYARLKSQFAAIKAGHGECRFIYLMGRSPRGEIFFFVDSEPADSKDCSPPGQVYGEASEGCRRVFDTGIPAVVGPTTDRWGTWVSAFVPVKDPQTGSLLSVLGMDIDARRWRGEVARAGVSPVLLTVVLVLILLAGMGLSMRRLQRRESPANWMRYLEPGLIFAVGVTVTVFAAWTADQREHHDRDQAFALTAASETDAIVEPLRSLRNTRLEGLADFFEGSESVTAPEFEQYTAHLTADVEVEVWGWCRAVPAAEKAAFEAERRAAEGSDFEVWQKDAEGKRVPVEGRDTYYPVVFVAPLEGHEAMLGYDLGSEPRHRLALEESARTRLPTVADPAAVPGGDGQTSMHFYRPVFDRGHRGMLQGAVFAEMRMGALLQRAIQDGSALLEIALLGEGGVAETIASDRGSYEWDASCPSFWCPIFIFGRVLTATAYAGESFLRLYPVRAGRVAGLTGFVLSVALSLMVGLVLRRRAELEWLVAERTVRLREREETFRALAENSRDTIMRFDSEGRHLYVNPAVERLTGLAPEAFLGKTHEVLGFPPHLCDVWEEAIRRVFDTGSVHRTEFQLPNGIWLDWQLVPEFDDSGHVKAVMTSARDITERKRAEEALEKRMMALTQPLDNPEGIAFEDLFNVEDIQRLQDEFARATGVASLITHPDGTPITKPGNFSRFCGEIVRRTETGRMNCEHSDAQLGVVVQDGPIVRPCLSAGLWGAGAGITVGGRHIASWLIGQVRDETISEDRLREYARTIGVDEAELIEAYYEVPVMSQERFRAIAQVLFTLAKQLSTLAYQNVQQARFIEERKRAEEERERLQSQLAQAQKMESVGRLAGGVAHDFNNMLSVILGHTELAMDAMSPSDPLLADLQEIRKAAERSADLTRQLLAFARKQTVAPKVLDLNETVEGTLKMLRRLIGEDIELSWLPGENVAPVKMDPSQIDQILANLCVNARDAIGDTGKVIIETGAAMFDEAYCAEYADVVPGEYAMMAVSDDGCGMSPEMQAHLFEPFFTTKEVGKGTGLGLATVYGIVKQNNGFINVYSEPGHGTTFRIYFPRYTGKVESVQKEGAAEPSVRGRETVLLVEDEPAILRLTTRILGDLGYTVAPASTPGEAIRLAAAHSGEIHLLITDVVMPEMNGRDLAKNLLSMYPGMKRLFMSGYTASVIAHRGVLDEGVHFIQKPFSKRDLAAKVREALDSE